jgi:hypothetical protein
LQGDVRVVLPAAGLPFVPSDATDVVVLDGETLKIVSLRTLYSGADHVLYDVQVRK